MKINQPAFGAAAEERTPVPAIPMPRARPSASSTRQAATAAGAAVAESTVGLAFFLSRRPTAGFGRHHAKFRA
jgi:hypothetical protein